MSFYDYSLPQQIIDNLYNVYNIKEPNEVQVKSFSAIKEGRDLILSSPTGTGKTLAYLLPLISTTDITLKTVQVLIITSSQELCMQINKLIQNVYGSDLIHDKSCVLIGDGNITRQTEQLKKKPVYIIGTPGRVKQLIDNKKLHVHDVKTIVLDEADKLFDKSNFDNVLSIRKSCMKRTQVLLFSASISSKTIKLAKDFTYKHIYVITDRRERIETLRKVVKAINSTKSIIFINTKYDLEETFQKLEYHHYKVASVSGNKDKNEKKKAIDDFANGKINYLLSTDVSARGLQFDNIEAVINLNLPEDNTDYQHRAGRCGRNNQSGLCISIITENELFKIKKLQKQFNINMIQKRLYNGKLVSK